MKLIWIVFITIIFSCSKEGKYLISPDNIRSCHYKNLEDSNKIKEILIGNWLWTHSESYWSPGNYAIHYDKELTINFNNENQYTLTQPGHPDITGNYRLIVDGSAFFNVSTEPHIELFKGYFFVCDNYMMYDLTYLDRSLSIFEKVR